MQLNGDYMEASSIEHLKLMYVSPRLHMICCWMQGPRIMKSCIALHSPGHSCCGGKQRLVQQCHSEPLSYQHLPKYVEGKHMGDRRFGNLQHQAELSKTTIPVASHRIAAST